MILIFFSYFCSWRSTDCAGLHQEGINTFGHSFSYQPLSPQNWPIHPAFLFHEDHHKVRIKLTLSHFNEIICQCSNKAVASDLCWKRKIKEKSTFHSTVGKGAQRASSNLTKRFCTKRDRAGYCDQYCWKERGQK